jgi:hypothetical protein
MHIIPYQFYMRPTIVSVGMVTRPWVGQPRNCGSILNMGDRSNSPPHLSNGKTGLEAYITSYSMRSKGSLSKSKKFEYYPYLVPRLNMGGILSSLPHIPSWHAHRQLYVNHELYTFSRRYYHLMVIYNNM